MDAANETATMDEATATKKERPTIVTETGYVLHLWPGTEKRVPIEEMIRRRDEFYEQYKHLLKNYSVDQFLREKRRDVEMGIE